MSSAFNPPLSPTIGHGLGLSGGAAYAQTRNPFFNVSNQFLPRNLHDVIRWVRFITIHSPVTTEVLRKLSTYPITDFIYSVKDPEVIAKYKSIAKAFKLKSTLHNIGIQYHTIGNVFVSIYYPFLRSLKCKNCGTLHTTKKSDFLKIKNYQYVGTCPVCGHSGDFEVKDVKSQTLEDMNLIIWDPLNISVNHNPISGKNKYYFKIPNEFKRKIQQGDRHTFDSVNWEFIEAIRDNKDFEFEDGFIFHLKNVDLGMSVDGVSIPPLVSHFSLVFYQTTLRRANESIATDFMAPMRVIFPQPQTANSDPVTSFSMRNFVARMEEAVVKHKHDNNHVLIAPVPIGYQAISGEGKALLVNQEIAQAEESLLLSMGVSRELLSGTTNWTSSTVGLRMLKNTLESYTGQIEELLDWMTDGISVYLNIPKSTITLTPFQLTDDEFLKQIIQSLAQSGSISLTTVFESLGRDYTEELTRQREEAKLRARHEIRTKYEADRAAYLEGVDIAKESDENTSYTEVLKKCQDLALQLVNSDPNTTRQVLNELKITDYASYLMTSKLLEEHRTEQTQMVKMEESAQLRGGNTGEPAAAGQPNFIDPQSSGPSGPSESAGIMQ